MLRSAQNEQSCTPAQPSDQVNPLDLKIDQVTQFWNRKHAFMEPHK